MSRSKVENTIRGIYAALEALESKYVGRMTSQLFQCYDAALAGERQHRSGRLVGEFKLSPQVAACYFACKWTLLHPLHPPTSWSMVTEMRPDAVLGAGLGERLDKVTAAASELSKLREEIATIDYVRDIAGAK